MEGFNPGAQQAPSNESATQKKEYFTYNEKKRRWELTDKELINQIQARAKEIMVQQGLKRVFPVVVRGEEYDSKPIYIAYFKRPDIATYSRFMANVQNDEVQASMILAQSTIVDGDAELVNDEDLFAFGTMNQLTPIISGRGGEVVKLQSVGK